MPERTLEHLLRRHAAAPGLEVFSVEADAAQLVWSDLPPGRHRVVVDGSAGSRVVEVDHPGGHGALVLDGLTAGTPHTVTVAGLTRHLHTLPDRGPVLSRVATISDLHIGRGELRYRGPMSPSIDESRPAGDDPTVRCASAAITEALDWGAQAIVVKGDVAEQTYAHVWESIAELFADLPVPLLMIPGNHDTGGLRHFEPEHGAARHGLTMVRGVEHLDLPGVRVVTVDSTVPGSGWGTLDRSAGAVAEAVAGAEGGALVLTHHHPQPFALPYHWPHGVPGPDARRFARAVRAANPRLLASSGHTHRCRRRSVAGVAWTEVAATNHFPAVWAGYTVHEGAISQTVRRIARPDAMAWSESTRPVLGGVWALWSTGRLADRCFTLDW